eukprot:gene15628-33015_t
MVAALQQGEIDAAHSVPSSSFATLGDTEGIEAVFGQQGGFTELAMNGMAGGLGDGHPALQDIEVRHAIHRAIDKQALFDRVILGLGTPGVTLSASPDPAWKPDIPEAEQYTYDPAAANAALDAAGYDAAMRGEIAHAVQRQQALGLDVLVHGEAERNDMVEYFGEQLDGFGFTRFGWVQSYGSRCVKPPILFGDVARPGPMTVGWTAHAQSLADRPVKGMLTGPVTILQWSFVRDDQPRSLTALQIALAMRAEVADLEAAGIGMIQIDEPALREGLPLRRARWDDYLAWATRAFRVTAGVAGAATQIHTHMCYAEFNDILPQIAALDADVITIETSRSDMALLDGFGKFSYPNEIGPGVYDIHSPRVPEGRASDPAAPPLGEPGLRTENAGMGRDRGGAGEHGGGGQAHALAICLGLNAPGPQSTAQADPDDGSDPRSLLPGFTIPFPQSTL